MLTRDWRALRPPPAPPTSPEAGEGDQRSILGECKPCRGLAGLRVFVLAEAGRGHETPVPRREPTAPVRTRDVADVVTGWPPNRGGPGMPQRAMTSSRSPSALLRTIGAI